MRALDGGHIRLGQVRRGEAWRSGLIPNFTIVSFTHGGLTALTRKFRGISSAAARTKPSRPALTIEMDALPGMGCIAPIDALGVPRTVLPLTAVLAWYTLLA